MSGMKPENPFSPILKKPGGGRLVILILSATLLAANLSALVDLFLHPDIPYFDEEHLIVGGAFALFAATSFLLLSIYLARARCTEADLRNLEHKYHCLFDNLTDAAFLADAATGAILETNLKGAQLLGRSRAEILTMHQGDVHPPGQEEEYHRRFLAHVEKGHQADYDGEVIRKDGAVVPVSIAASPFTLAGRPLIIGLFRDITDRKKAETLLIEKEKFLSDILDSIQDGISILNPDMEVVRINRAMQGYFPAGRPLVGRKCFAAYHDRTEPCVACPSLGTFQSGRPNSKVFLADTGKGAGTAWLELSTFPFFDRQSERVDFVIEYLRDITARVTAEEKIKSMNEELELKVEERTQELLAAQEELVRREKLAVLGQVADNVGHELRNPLGVMSNAVYFLQTVLVDGNETTREYLGIIEDEIAAADRIVGDLLDSVRTKPPQPHITNSGELLDQVMTRCKMAPSVKVRLEITKMLPSIVVDPVQMEQVFRNLIANALDAMPEGGELEIRAEEKENRMVAIRVRDSGIGMTAEQKEKLFQPLYTTKARHVGLGLMVVKNLTAANNGTVEVESEPGKGTAFTVSLPTKAGPSED